MTLLYSAAVQLPDLPMMLAALAALQRTPSARPGVLRGIAVPARVSTSP